MVPYAQGRAFVCTDPQSIYFACHNGISANPMYFQCDFCPNFDCDLRNETYGDFDEADDFPPVDF